jgi:hypothetical protein
MAVTLTCTFCAERRVIDRCKGLAASIIADENIRLRSGKRLIQIVADTDGRRIYEAAPKILLCLLVQIAIPGQ